MYCLMRCGQWRIFMHLDGHKTGGRHPPVKKVYGLLDLVERCHLSLVISRTHVHTSILLTRPRLDAAGKDLLQKVTIPTLTFGAETWRRLTEKEKNKINNVQTDYLTKLVEVPRTLLDVHYQVAWYSQKLNLLQIPENSDIMLTYKIKMKVNQK